MVETIPLFAHANLLICRLPQPQIGDSIMAETASQAGVGTPQYVAYLLTIYLTRHEKLPDRKALLDAYAECLDAAIGARDYPKK
jgi:hypothetical protein